MFSNAGPARDYYIAAALGEWIEVPIWTGSVWEGHIKAV